VLSHELGIGKNSRLYRRLVLRDELVTEVTVINETRLDPGALFVLAELREGADLQTVERAVREEIEALVEEGVAKTDLQRIRAQIQAAFLFQDEAVLELALKLARFEALTPEGHRTLAGVLPVYESLTNRELKAAAAKYLLPERSACVWSVASAAAGSNGSPARGKGKKRK
jgi:zinc protease